MAKTHTIDITPTWRSILPVLVLAVEQGTPEGRRIALEELNRMADIADEYIKTTKEN